MPVFISSTSVARQHGVYALERKPPSVIRPIGAAVTAMVEQFPWGPDQTPTDVADTNTLIQTFAPFGMSHTGAGYMSALYKSWPFLKVARVTGSTGAAKSTATVNKTGPTAMLTLTLKYNGAAGNSVTATTSAASDGDANHFNLTVTVTSTTGTTTDFIQNLNYSGVGADSTPDLSSCLLLGSITKTAAGVPLLQSWTFAGGSDGTITAADYVGTQGSANRGIALFEGDQTVDFVITGDPGNTFRATVNAGLVAHADYLTDRQAIINGNSGLAQSAAITDVASYRSKRAIYVDVWAYVKNDIDGTDTLVPPAPFFASVAANLSPSTSPAWKSATVKALMSKISKLEVLRGAAAPTGTAAGICTLIKELQGGFTFEAAVNTNYPIDPSTGSYKRTRMGHYMAKSITQSLRESVDAPNVPSVQNDEIQAVKQFLDQLVRNKDVDPFNLPHLYAAGMDDVTSFNSFASQQAGQFTLPFTATVSADQSFIFLSMNYGETAVVTASI